MAKWFGEVREYTPNELSFMVKAAQQCRLCQKNGECAWGSKECCTCKWQAPMAAIKEQDPFMQSRIEDKADMLDEMDAMFLESLKQSQGKAKDYANRLWMFLAAAAAIIVAAVLFCNSAYSMPNEARSVMKQLALSGPDDYYYDGKQDCKDWAISFMQLWYRTGAADGSCILVRNLNRDLLFDHLMVAVKEDGKWLVIEPQACRCNEAWWNPAMWWGDKYDKSYDMYGQSWLYLHSANKDAKQLLERSNSTYEDFERSMKWEKR